MISEGYEEDYPEQSERLFDDSFVSFMDRIADILLHNSVLAPSSTKSKSAFDWCKEGF